MNTTALLDVYSHIQIPVPFVRAEGMYLYDRNGRAYLDLYGGHCVCCLGHSPPRVVEVLERHAREFLFYSNLVNIPMRDECAGALIRFANNGFSKVFFCNSGAEANENALKIAIKRTGRQGIAAFKGAFHGRTSLAMGATDNNAWHDTFCGWQGPVVRLMPNDRAGLEFLTKDIAAVILEPIQSIGGVTLFEFDYLQELKAVCERIGALLIFDEVQTGVARTGTPFVSGYCGVLPDIMTLAKGLAAGFPIGAVVMTDNIAEGVAPGDLGATFGGNPLAMAAMQATLQEIESRNLGQNAVALEGYLRERAAALPIKRVQGRGLLLGLVIERAAKGIQGALLERGIIVGLNSNPNMIHLLPPLITERKHIDTLLNELASVLA